jgi:DNA mismatch repair protein MSH6
MMAAEEQKTSVLKDLSRRIFEKFSSNYNQWETAVHCIATVDILLSLAEFARQQTGDICLPEVTFNKNRKVSKKNIIAKLFTHKPALGPRGGLWPVPYV